VGFAIAGLVIGIVGSIWLIVAIMFLGFAGLISAFALGEIKDELRVHAVADAVEQYRRDTGFLPLTLDELVTTYPGKITPEFTENLGYRQTDVDKFVIIRPGPDKLLGTGDDVEFVPPSQSGSQSSSPASSPSSPQGGAAQVELENTTQPSPPPAPGN
jgi:hypothetical protein